jgi:hypothetical protein
MLLEPAPRAGGEPGKLVFGGTFDLAFEEPGDQAVRHRAPRQAARAQLLRGEGGRVRQITPGQTPPCAEALVRAGPFIIARRYRQRGRQIAPEP